jgi:hypothetical protein
METWALRPASHLARLLLRHCIDKENLPPKILRTRDPPLVMRTPLVHPPATNRARTLRKDISSLKTGVATVRQAYDGRPVRPRCRLLGFLFGGVGLGLHLYFLPWVWLPHQYLAATLSSILYNILQLYYQEGSGGGNVGAGVEGRDQAAIKQDSSEPRAGVDTRKASPARKWRARGRIEHTLLDGEFSVRPNRPKNLRPQTHPTTRSARCFYL